MKSTLFRLLQKLAPAAADKLDLRQLSPGNSAEEIAEALIRAAGRIEIAETRVW